MIFFFCISAILLLFSLLLFLILFICVLSLFFLVILARGLMIFKSLFSKPIFGFMNFFYFLVSVLFISPVIFIAAFFLFTLIFFLLLLFFLILLDGRLAYLRFFSFLEEGLYHYELSSLGLLHTTFVRPCFPCSLSQGIF